MALHLRGQDGLGLQGGEWEDAIPDEYMIQIQHYMAVTGCQGAYIAVLIGGNTFRWRFVERDEELIAMLISLEEDFWRHVQKGTPPALDGSNASARFLAERFPNSVPQSEIALPRNAQKLLSQYDEACRQLEESDSPEAGGGESAQGDAGRP